LISRKPGSCLLLSPPSAPPVLPKSAAFPEDSLLWSAGGVARLFPLQGAPSSAQAFLSPKQAAYYFLARFCSTFKSHPSFVSLAPRPLSTPIPPPSSKVLPLVLKPSPKQAASPKQTGYNGAAFNPSSTSHHSPSSPIPPLPAPRLALLSPLPSLPPCIIPFNACVLSRSKLPCARISLPALAAPLRVWPQLEATSTPAYLVNPGSGGGWCD
ncbi:unnamed protein product, partial [Closterium sp. Naga37s-1]